jgi:hypothetical protein
MSRTNRVTVLQVLLKLLQLARRRRTKISSWSCWYLTYPLESHSQRKGNALKQKWVYYSYIVIVFFQGIPGCVSKTYRVFGNKILDLLLWLQYMLHITLFPMIKVMHFYRTTSRNTNMCAVLYTAVFCSFLMSFFPGTPFRDFLNYFEMVLVDTVISCIAFILHST